MFRKSTMLCVCALTALMLSSVVFAQQAQLPKQNPFLPYASTLPAVNTPAAALLNSSSQTLTLFTYTVTPSRDGNTYTGTIVGPSPFSRSRGSARVPTQIVPVVVTTNSVFAGVDSNGNVLTKPGVTVFDPTMADDSCSSPPFDVPLRISYRVELSPVNTLAAVQINIPEASGVAYPSAAFGGCPTGTEAIIDLTVFESTIENTILPALASQGVNPGDHRHLSGSQCGRVQRNQLRYTGSKHGVLRSRLP